MSNGRYVATYRTVTSPGPMAKTYLQRNVYVRLKAHQRRENLVESKNHLSFGTY